MFTDILLHTYMFFLESSYPRKLIHFLKIKRAKFILRFYSEINKLNKELKVLKEDYAEMIIKSYKSRSTQSRAMFLLSSENFLQAYKRLQYMKQYSSYRKMQGEEIKDNSVKLDEHNSKLTGQKSEKEKLISALF